MNTSTQSLELWDSIVKEIENGNYTHAKGKLHDIVHQGDGGLKALSLLGQIACTELQIKLADTDALKQPKTYVTLIEQSLNHGAFRDAYHIAIAASKCFPQVNDFNFGAAMAAELAGMLSESLNWFQRVVDNQANHYRAHERLMVISYKLGLHEQTKSSALILVTEQPNNIAALAMLSNIYSQEKNYQDSHQYLQRFINCNQFDNDELTLIAINVANRLCDFKSLDLLPSMLDTLARTQSGIVLANTICSPTLRSNSDTDTGLNQYLNMQKKLGELLQKNARNNPFALKITKQFPQQNHSKRLKYGFLSVSAIPKIGEILSPFFAALRALGNEVIFFNVSRNEDQQQQVLQSLGNSIDSFIPVQETESAQVAQTLAQKQIDIIVDLNGFQQPGSQVGVFSWRIAPLQLVWAGIPTPCLYDDVDGQILDPYLIHESQSGAPPLVLPNVWTCIPELPDLNLTRQQQDKQRTVFSVMCASEKIRPHQLQIWATLLKRSTSYAILFGRPEFSNPFIKAALTEFFQNEGVDPTQLMFLTEQVKNHLEIYQQVDVNLDAFPLHSGLTLIEAAWMGVPSIVLCGTEVHQRSGYSVLKNLEMAEGIAFDDDEYISKAELLAQRCNPVLRETYRIKVKQSPFFAIDRFTADFDSAVKERLCEVTCKG